VLIRTFREAVTSSALHARTAEGPIGQQRSVHRAARAEAKSLTAKQKTNKRWGADTTAVGTLPIKEGDLRQQNAEEMLRAGLPTSEIECQVGIHREQIRRGNQAAITSAGVTLPQEKSLGGVRRTSPKDSDPLIGPRHGAREYVRSQRNAGTFTDSATFRGPHHCSRTHSVPRERVLPLIRDVP
jgi:hypothetical protein